ncbi:hypothetical protein GE278_15580 [Enterobacteriaceae bacterium Kacie_13]|nr:hypothetical protein GE278_15580 [Enterobacteriaceae bacterium Kacie_13]
MKSKCYLYNKAIIATTIVSLFLTGTAYAGKVKSDPDPEPKSGSFKYVAPLGGGDNQCPGPYESMAITFVNETDALTENHGSAMVYNVFYAVNDQRKYTGDHAYVEQDQNVFPTESPSFPDPNAATFVSSWKSYGPIDGVYVNPTNTQQKPIHDGLDMGSHLREVSLLNSKTNELRSRGVLKGDESLKVMTAYALRSNFMDWINPGNNNVTIRLPVRSYKALIITARSTNPVEAKKVNKDAWSDGQITPFSDQSIYFDATQSSAENGSVMNVTEASRGGYHFALKTFPASSTLNLRAIDEIVFTSAGHGTDKSTSNTGATTGDPESGWKNSDIEVKYLKDKTTGNPINCN